MKIKNINFFLVNIIVIIMLTFAYDFPKNLYNILLHNYDERRLNIYGYCDKESFGYLEKINNLYKNININSFNFDDYPKSSTVLFYNINYPFDNSKLIILNYNSDNLLQQKYFLDNFSNYLILDNYKNKCFLLEKING